VLPQLSRCKPPLRYTARRPRRELPTSWRPTEGSDIGVATPDTRGAEWVQPQRPPMAVAAMPIAEWRRWMWVTPTERTDGGTAAGDTAEIPPVDPQGTTPCARSTRVFAASKDRQTSPRMDRGVSSAPPGSVPAFQRGHRISLLGHGAVPKPLLQCRDFLLGRSWPPRKALVTPRTFLGQRSLLYG
jgi:hypothetical protein